MNHEGIHSSDSKDVFSNHWEFHLLAGGYGGGWDAAMRSIKVSFFICNYQQHCLYLKIYCDMLLDGSSYAITIHSAVELKIGWTRYPDWIGVKTFPTAVSKCLCLVYCTDLLS